MSSSFPKFTYTRGSSILKSFSLRASETKKMIFLIFSGQCSLYFATRVISSIRTESSVGWIAFIWELCSHIVFPTPPGFHRQSRTVVWTIRRVTEKQIKWGFLGRQSQDHKITTQASGASVLVKSLIPCGFTKPRVHSHLGGHCREFTEVRQNLFSSHWGDKTYSRPTDTQLTKSLHPRPKVKDLKMKNQNMTQSKIELKSQYFEL